VIVNGNLYDGTDGLDGAALDGDQFQVAWNQTAPTASVQLFATQTNIPAVPVLAAANTQSILSALVVTSSGTNAPAGTGVTFQAVGPGLFQDTLTVANTVSANVGGGVYGTAATGESGCALGENLQSCNATTGTGADDGEAATAEATTGVASVAFEGAGVTGVSAITATVGTLSASVNVTLHGVAASVTAGRTGTGATLAAVEYIRNLGTATANVVVTVRDAAGNPVSNHIPTFAVTAPTLAAQQVVLAAAANGTIPGCAAPGTNANGQCNILVTGVTTQGTNTIRIRSANFTTANGIQTTIDVTLVGAAASVAIADSVPSEVQHLSTTPISVNVSDADGDPAPDGTVCAIAATGTGIITSVTTTAGGVCTGQLITGSVDGIVQLVVTVGTLTPVQKTITVEGVADPEDGDDGEEGEGGFTGDIADDGVSLVIFGGGSITVLAEAGEMENVISISLTVDGEFVVYIVGAPDFVNAAFSALFGEDGVPAGPVILKK